MHIANVIEFNSQLEIVADKAGIYHRPAGTTITDPTQLRLIFPRAKYRYKPTFEHQVAVSQAAAEGNELNLRALLGNTYVPINRAEWEPGWMLVHHRPSDLALTDLEDFDPPLDLDCEFSRPLADPRRKILRDLKGRRLSQVFFDEGVRFNSASFKNHCMTQTCDVIKLLGSLYPPSFVDWLFDPIHVIASEIATIALDSEYKKICIEDKDEDCILRSIDNYMRACITPKFPVFAMSYQILKPIIYGGNWKGADVQSCFDDDSLDLLVCDESLLELTLVCDKKSGHVEWIEFDLAEAERYAEGGVYPEWSPQSMVLGFLEGDVLQEAKAMVASQLRRMSFAARAH